MSTIYHTDESDSESDDDRPDLFEPFDLDSPFSLPRLTPQRNPCSLLTKPLFCAPLRAILLSDKPSLILPLTLAPEKKRQTQHTIGARIQAFT
jgi:hypothetical protein